MLGSGLGDWKCDGEEMDALGSSKVTVMGSLPSELIASPL